MSTFTRTDSPAYRIGRVRHVSVWTRQFAERRGMPPGLAHSLAMLTAAMVRSGLSPARAYLHATEIVRASLPAPGDLAQAA